RLPRRQRDQVPVRVQVLVAGRPLHGEAHRHQDERRDRRGEVRQALRDEVESAKLQVEKYVESWAAASWPPFFLYLSRNQLAATDDRFDVAGPVEYGAIDPGVVIRRPELHHLTRSQLAKQPDDRLVLQIAIDQVEIRRVLVDSPLRRAS